MLLSSLLGNSKGLGALSQKPGIKTKWIFLSSSQYCVSKSCCIFKDEVFQNLSCQLNFNVCHMENKGFFFPPFFVFYFCLVLLFHWLLLLDSSIFSPLLLEMKCDNSLWKCCSGCPFSLDHFPTGSIKLSVSLTWLLQ